MSKRRKNNTTPPETVIAEAILKGLWWVVSTPFKMIFGKKGSSAAKSDIPPMIAAQLASHWPQRADAQAVAEADKLLDAAFQAAGIPGATFADRLRSAERKFSASLYQEIWSAHKLRNSFAHDLGVSASDSEIHQALNAFRAALRQLGLPL